MDQASGATAERTPGMTRTRLVVKLATDDTLPVQAHFEHTPPTIVIDLPSGRVSGSLPERSSIGRGGIREIRAIYASSKRSSEARSIKGLAIELQDAYKYEVTAEPGRIVIDVEHPPEVAGGAIELGVADSILINTVAKPVSERFQAMQDAMTQAQPAPIRTAVGSGAPLATRSLSTQSTGGAGPTLGKVSSDRSANHGTAPTPRSPAIVVDRSGWWLWMIGGIWLAAACGVLWLWLNRRHAGRSTPTETPSRISSAVRIVDQLVWRSFERNAYQLVHLTESSQPSGILRIIAKEGAKAALLCVGDGTFFEKTTVEQLAELMQQAHASQGFLVAPGSFTVPAQRLAQEHNISLLGRERLTELISDGAASEHQTSQIRQLTAQLDEMKETLNQYARQLDVIRRQRNEASWFLGEERAKFAKLEEQLGELTQQLRHWQSQAEGWQQTVEATKKQWEESEWFLGESRAYAKHLEEQLSGLEEQARGLEQTAGQLQETCSQLEARAQEAERQRDQANWFLGESRTAQEALRQQAEQAARALEAEQSYRRTLEDELAAIRVHGERRAAFRICRPGMTVELQDSSGATIFRGLPRDISRTGFGIEMEQPLGQSETFQVRLAFPGVDRLVEATGRVVWQRHDATAPRYLSGYELTALSPDLAQRLIRFNQVPVVMTV
ncbi:MAG: PilZ domain-containing protein [Candidatus Omnitrophica bacterium]|nr:PilZ domain-containing protein [Candidatus Omnitrophota bacterium]